MAKLAEASGGEPLDFEGEMAQLESIVHDLETGQLGLGESLQRYERGVKHLKTCYELLQKAEQRVRLLLEVDSQGNEQTESFSEDAMSLDEKADQRSRRRSRRPTGKDREEGPASEDVDGSRGLF
jgi:exodeoxyribonuclease VII small subunit